jgi:hypothetical protein
MFLTHPPVCRFRVDVRDAEHPVTRGLAKSCEVEDEPYFIELQAPASVQILLMADYGAVGRLPVVENLHGTDTFVQPNGETRCSATRAGSVAAPCHCHNPYSRMGRTTAGGGKPSLLFRGPWESPPFTTLLSNAITWARRSHRWINVLHGPLPQKVARQSASVPLAKPIIARPWSDP